MPLSRLSVLALLATLLAAPALAQPPAPLRTMTASTGETLSYVLLLPEPYDALKAYPTLLALPPGDGSEDAVRKALAMYWESAAKARGWVVISPVAPASKPFADAGAPLLTELLDEVARTVRFENGLVHAAGMSKGGHAAFRAALDSPGRFASLLVLPGVPPTPADFERLGRLKNVPVTMYVGAADNDYWLGESRRAAARCKEAGVEHSLTVLDGQEHVLTIDPRELFDRLDARRPAARASLAARDASVRAIARVLDDFHDAAAKADEVRYFAHFADDAVFLGTDATERWTLPQFRAFAQPYFQRGTAWTYTPRRRWITVSPGGDAAWFDETLDNAKLGDCRGSGALIRTGGEWKITQYNLTVPVPNELMDKVVDLIRAARAPAGAP